MGVWCMTQELSCMWTVHPTTILWKELSWKISIWLCWFCITNLSSLIHAYSKKAKARVCFSLFISINSFENSCHLPFIMGTFVDVRHWECIWWNDINVTKNVPFSVWADATRLRVWIIRMNLKTSLSWATLNPSRFFVQFGWTCSSKRVHLWFIWLLRTINLIEFVELYLQKSTNSSSICFTASVVEWQAWVKTSKANQHHVNLSKSSASVQQPTAKASAHDVSVRCEIVNFAKEARRAQPQLQIIFTAKPLAQWQCSLQIILLMNGSHHIHWA